MEVILRGTLRAQLTKMCNAATELINKVNSNREQQLDKDKLKVEIDCLLKRIMNVNTNLLKANIEVKDMISEQEMAKECESVVEYDDKAISIMAQLESALERLSCNGNENRSTPATTLTQVPQELTQQLHIPEIKLKPMELKKFKGQFEEWLPFWEQFRVAVHENEALPVAVKFNYLSNSLEGKAAATISGFLPTADCYSEAIKILRDEYGHNDNIIEKYIQKLLGMKAIHMMNDVKGLRFLYNEVSSTMRTLEALEVSPSKYELMVKSILLKALPVSLRTNYHRIAGQSNGDNGSQQIKSLLEFLKQEIEALEKAFLSEKDTKGNEVKKDYREYTHKGTATALMTNTSNQKLQYCIFCKNNMHNTRNCKAKISLSDKKALLKREGRCFRCSNKSHTSKFCRAQWVKCDECSGRHLTSLCERNKEYEEEKKNAHTVNGNSVSSTATAMNVTNNEQTNVYLQTAKAEFLNAKENKKLLSRIILDNASQRTFVTQALKNELKLKKSGMQNMKIISFGEKIKNSSAYETVAIKLKSQYSNKIENITAVVVPNICTDTLPVADANKLANFKSSNWADINMSKQKLFSGINLLIGQDYYWKFNTNKCVKLENNLTAVDTFFGWTIQGCERNGRGNCVFNINNEIDETFEIANFWSLESIGIKNLDQVENKTVKNLNIVMKNGRYEVNLPWKINKENISSNRSVALKRLYSLTTKLMQSGKIDEYDNQIKSLLSDGIIERASENEDIPKYYMPHKAVYRNDKVTTKTRIVFDASSSAQGVLSLNDYLSEGENAVADLLSILLRFRENPYAMVADIEKAFLQISLDPEDRDVHRFLWFETTPKQNKQIPSPVEYRMTRVTFGVTSSPYLLAATIKKHLEIHKQNNEAICELLKNSFYVDDLVLSVRNKSEAKYIAEKASEIMAAGKFKLCKWNCNDSEVLQNLSSDDVTKACKQKVLGINWYTLTDEINVEIECSSEYLQLLRPTKRNVLKAMAKVFDPIGVLGPFTVRIKILLQKIWRIKTEWDELLPNDLNKEFVEWQDDLVNLKDFNIKRCFNKCGSSKTELHIFSDASSYAFGAVAYVKQISKNGDIFVEFLCSKNRIRPLKKCGNQGDLTMPKLELTAALIAARLKSFILKAITVRFDSVSLWADSTIALDWIRGRGKQLQQYVKARVSEINSLTNVYEWKYCQGKLNPADLLTRGIKAKILINSELWRCGPPWLTEKNIENFENNFVMITATEIETELENVEMEQSVIEISKYSKLSKLLRVTAWTFRFVKLVKKQQTRQGKTDLTYFEIQEALNYCIKIEQLKYFKNEFISLLKIGSVQRQSKIYMMNPILANGIIKMQSRLPEYGDITGHPIILPKDSHLSYLLIHEAHQVTLHGGINSVLAYIRKNYWIIQGRQLIKKILNKCVVCKRLHGKPGSENWTVIPDYRIHASRPFETTGIDFAGPLYVKQINEDSQKKVYILLFTCAAIRAIHLELLSDMTVKSCIEAFRRFIARYGVPKIVISDNARTFKRVDIEFRKLESLLKTNEMQQLATQKGISWKFIPERAAWWGGFWERLVRSVKTSLKATIGIAVLTFEELTTVLAEVESVINSRPLVYISNDPNDLEPLTPSHFLCTANLLLPDNFESDGSQIAESWAIRQKIIKKYWKRWETEYLSQLRTLHLNKGKTQNSIKVNDVVLIHDECKSKLKWKLGLVKSTFPGRDGKIRVCEVRTANGNVLRRPVQLLYPLEVSEPFFVAAGCKN